MAINTKEKLAGLLVPAFALRHKDDLGIGDTTAVKQAIEFCGLNKIGVLQLLPINETGGDNSPYNAVSASALDPALLTLTPDMVPGLSPDDVASVFPEDLINQLKSGSVHYGKVKKAKLDVLRRAFTRWQESAAKVNQALSQELASFEKENEKWLKPYTLFRALIDRHNGNTAWPTWEKELQSYKDASKSAMIKSDQEIARAVKFFAFVQWIAYRQWLDVRRFADEHAVRLMGDLPFGVSRYSADVWAEKQLFDLGWSCGAPPETYFQSDTFTRKWGQNWGMPFYRWTAHEKEDFAWWRMRVKNTTRLFHAFRIDHVLGFFRVWAFPWIPERNHEFVDLTEEEAAEVTGGELPQFIPRSDEDPEDAEENCLEGKAILEVLIDAAGDAAIVAEDLGFVPDYVRPLIHELGIAGFSIPIFERDEKDRSYKAKETLPVLSLATYGTHDHQPLKTFYEALVKQWLGPDGNEGWLELQRLMRFLGMDPEKPPRTFTAELQRNFITTLLETPCWLAVLMVTDLLGTSQRFNEPGLSGDYNWSQRLDKEILAYQSDSTYSQMITSFQELIDATHRAPKVLSPTKRRAGS